MLVCSLNRISVPASPLPPSRQVQNKLYLLWEEEEKMCGVIRLPAASRGNWVVAVADLQGVCSSPCDLCLLWTLSIGVRWLTGAATPVLKKKKVIDLIKAFSWWVLFALYLLGDQRRRGNVDQRCEATGWDLIRVADELSVIKLSNEFETQKSKLVCSDAKDMICLKNVRLRQLHRWRPSNLLFLLFSFHTTCFHTLLHFGAPVKCCYFTFNYTKPKLLYEHDWLLLLFKDNGKHFVPWRQYVLTCFLTWLNLVTIFFFLTQWGH